VAYRLKADPVDFIAYHGVHLPSFASDRQRRVDRATAPAILDGALKRFDEIIAFDRRLPKFEDCLSPFLSGLAHPGGNLLEGLCKRGRIRWSIERRIRDDLAPLQRLQQRIVEVPCQLRALLQTFVE